MKSAATRAVGATQPVLSHDWSVSFTLDVRYCYRPAHLPRTTVERRLLTRSSLSPSPGRRTSACPCGPVSLWWCNGIEFLLFMYGGAPYQTQESKLMRDVDIVVGTPGRVKDHIERKNIDLIQLKFHVLDEANEMLRMDFVKKLAMIQKRVQPKNSIPNKQNREPPHEKVFDITIDPR
ncbi:hypothetical protein AHAS_Ahas04G0052100 [Arachis hypogaea]